MTNLTKIDRPFGLLDPETQEALRIEGRKGNVEVFCDGGWMTGGSISICDHLTYRARPAPFVPDTIDWSHVAPEWKWMARDEDGEGFLFRSMPEIDDGGYWCDDENLEADVFASYRRGTVAWQDSLVKRPEGV